MITITNVLRRLTKITLKCLASLPAHVPPAARSAPCLSPCLPACLPACQAVCQSARLPGETSAYELMSLSSSGAATDNPPKPSTPNSAWGTQIIGGPGPMWALPPRYVPCCTVQGLGITGAPQAQPPGCTWLGVFLGIEDVGLVRVLWLWIQGFDLRPRVFCLYGLCCYIMFMNCLLTFVLESWLSGFRAMSSLSGFSLRPAGSPSLRRLEVCPRRCALVGGHFQHAQPWVIQSVSTYCQKCWKC